MTAQPSVVDRVKMAVAEAGYDPTLVKEPLLPFEAFRFSRTLPLRVAWRARETAVIGPPLCFVCRQTRGERRGTSPPAPRHLWGWTCLADRRFMDDCGADRSELEAGAS